MENMTHTNDDFIKVLSILQSYRINIKNVGNAGNTIDVISASDIAIEEPAWIKNDEGEGKSLTGSGIHNELLVTVKQSGVLKIWFRGKDRYSDNKRFPVWVDYKSIRINSVEILSSPVETWHDEPFFFSIPVKDGENIKIEFEQRFHRYSKNDLKKLLKKLIPSFNLFEDFYDYYKAIIDNELNYSWTNIKTAILPEKPLYLNVNDIKKDTKGRLQIGIGGTKFETLLLPRTDSKKLVVSLTAMGKPGEQYPFFMRWTWYRYFDEMYACFDDPTRFEQKFAPAFYFGTEEENYLNYLKQIIEKISQVNNIPLKNITIISSSNGGFAALWLADKLPGSTAIALCPQVDVTSYRNNFLYSTLALKNEVSHYFDRLKVLDILKNKKSNFFIYSNILCGTDKNQMKILFDEAGIELKQGLIQIAPRVRCLITEIDAPDPHLAQPNPKFVDVILSTIKKPITNEIAALYKAYINEMKIFYAQQKKELA